MPETTRRDFLKSSTLVAGGLMTGLSARAYASGDDTIRIGLVGCGGRGNGAAAQALGTEGNVQLVAVGDAFSDRVESGLNRIRKAVENVQGADVAVDEDHKFVGLDAFQKVIDSDIDLVILATPPGFRPQHFEYAVQKGRHIFMEKPVATDAAGIKRVLESARKAREQNLKVGVGLQRRHQSQYLELVDRIHQGLVGNVRALRVYWNGGGVWDPPATREQCRNELEYQMRNWYYYNWLCGDHICEQHIHNIDVGNWVMQGQIAADPDNPWAQYPVKAQGMGGREVRVDPKYGEIFDHHAVEFTYADGTVMMSHCRHIRNCWNTVTEHVHGETGIVDLSSNPRQNRVKIFGSGEEAYKGKNPDPYCVEHDVLFAAIRNGTEHNEADYGARSTMTSILGRMCTYSGKELSMKDAFERGLTLVPDMLGWDAEPPVLPGPDGIYAVPVPGVTEVLA